MVCFVWNGACRRIGLSKLAHRALKKGIPKRYILFDPHTAAGASIGFVLFAKLSGRFTATGRSFVTANRDLGGEKSPKRSSSVRPLRCKPIICCPWSANVSTGCLVDEDTVSPIPQPKMELGRENLKPPITTDRRQPLDEHEIRYIILWPLREQKPRA